MTPFPKAVPHASPPTETPVAPAENRPFLWLLLLFSWRVAALEAENARLLAAIRRESHHMDVRAPHSGRK